MKIPTSADIILAPINFFIGTEENKEKRTLRKLDLAIALGALLLLLYMTFILHTVTKPITHERSLDEYITSAPADPFLD